MKRAIKNIGFIGLGTMGREMARNLLTRNFSVKVFDINPDVMAGLAKQGGIGVKRIKDMEDVDAIVSMLPDTPQVEEIVLGAGGVRDYPPQGKLYIDMSSISPHASVALAQALEGRGVMMLDAPVSGGPSGAKSASLSIMVGGDRRGFEYAFPVFQAMGTTIHHVGGSGCGQSMKLCNQLVCAINIEAICEALVLARAHNLDLKQMREVLLGGSAASWMLENLGSAMIAGDTRAGFRIDLMVKDLRLVQEAAVQENVPLPATSLVASHYRQAQQQGEGACGNQALFRVYDRMVSDQNPMR